MTVFNGDRVEENEKFRRWMLVTVAQNYKPILKANSWYVNDVPKNYKKCYTSPPDFYYCNHMN